MERQDLPTELVIYILETTAQISVQFCLTLSLVSSWTRRLALPHLFTTVVLKDNTSFFKFLEPLDKQPPKHPWPDCRPLHHVQNLWLEVAQPSLRTVFSGCCNLQKLALDHEAFTWLVFLSSTLAEDRCRQAFLPFANPTRSTGLDVLMILHDRRNWTNLLKHYQDSYFVPRITRLRLPYLKSYDRQCLPAKSFPRLSHLAIPFYDLQLHDLALLEPVLALEGLEVLVVVIMTDRTSSAAYKSVLAWFSNTHSMTSKVFLAEATSDDVETSWKLEGKGGDSIWDCATVFTQSLTLNGD
ncbi:hypothetical protein HGRIS_008989 [Hohenbuehelia grisea]|uniref:F-box domain-containing protein n=1 Tax=Hohenbuehelia grisea TaxID=104357 RepID=A0ABR3J074_9AGAR